MTDPRPTENQDDYPKFPTLMAMFGQAFEPPAKNPIEDLLERAENAHLPEQGLVYAQMATVRAVQAQTEQLRMANLIALLASERSEAALFLDMHDLADEIRAGVLS